MEIKLKVNSNLTIKNHNGITLCSVDEATGNIVGSGTKLYRHELLIEDDDGNVHEIRLVSTYNQIYGYQYQISSDFQEGNIFSCTIVYENADDDYTTGILARNAFGEIDIYVIDGTGLVKLVNWIVNVNKDTVTEL